MPKYHVTIPIAGHAYYTVEAESEAQAVELANEEPSDYDDLDWDLFPNGLNEGNVCLAPLPWEAEVTLLDETEEGEIA